MMRSRICLLCAVLFSVASAVGAQPVATEAIEKHFDKIRSSLKLERFQQDREIVAGESLRFEYLYYHDSNGKLVKMRVLEFENEPNASVKVDDYFFANGDLRLVRLYFFMNSSRLETLRKGEIVPLLTGEHIEMKDGKLVRWNALGKEIPSTDRRWRDKTTSVTTSLGVEMMFYKEFKKPKG
ncbi:MAG: hypothetical protein ABIR33_14325 [Pyrinomonadaceae bacterium]